VAGEPIKDFATCQGLFCAEKSLPRGRREAGRRAGGGGWVGIYSPDDRYNIAECGIAKLNLRWTSETIGARRVDPPHLPPLRPSAAEF
jgi:hypothetical protein